MRTPEISCEGIDAESLPFIFERFFRAERSRSRDVGGAGIGLAMGVLCGLTAVAFTVPPFDHLFKLSVPPADFLAVIGAAALFVTWVHMARQAL